MKKSIVALLVVFALMLTSIPVFANNEGKNDKGKEDPQTVIENQKNADIKGNDALAAVENASDKVPVITVRRIREKLADRFAELNKLRAECKILWEQIKALNDARTKAWQELKTAAAAIDRKAKNKIFADLKVQLQPYRDAVQKFQTEVKALRALKEAEWVQFRAALKDRNLGQATSAINAIIKYKSQIIDKQKAIIPVKTKIVEILKAAIELVKAAPKASPAPAPAATPAPTTAP